MASYGVHETPRIPIRNVCKTKQKRKLPSEYQRAQILQEQKERCFYCGLKFGDWYHDGKYARERSICWDHLLPYSHSYNNDNENFVAACSQCNSIKADKVFGCLREAAEYVRSRRKTKGLPMSGVWGNNKTKKVLATVLFNDLSKQVFLEDPQKGDSPDELEQRLDNIQQLQRLLSKVTKERKSPAAH